MPLANPMAVWLRVGQAMAFHGPTEPVARCTTYLLIAAPPLRDGASQASLTVVLPGFAVGDRGTVGTVRGTALTAVLDGCQPAVLWATMRK
jgi:hypothetical protein